MSEQVGRRVRVTSPQMAAASRAGKRPLARTDEEVGPPDATAVSGLVRAQLRIAAGVLGVLAVTLGALPVLFAWIPWLRTGRLGGLPLPWLLLGLLAYPFIIVVSRVYVRLAERAEASWSAAGQPPDREVSGVGGHATDGMP